MPEGIRRVENKAAAPEEAALDDILFVSPLPPSADDTFAHRRHLPEDGHGVARARRARRHQRPTRDRHFPGFGYAHVRPREKDRRRRTLSGPRSERHEGTPMRSS